MTTHEFSNVEVVCSTIQQANLLSNFKTVKSDMNDAYTHLFFRLTQFDCNQRRTDMNRIEKGELRDIWMMTKEKQQKDNIDLYSGFRLIIYTLFVMTTMMIQHPYFTVMIYDDS
jgi:uncharacterized protein YcbK (DUF882 family)